MELQSQNIDHNLPPLCALLPPSPCIHPPDNESLDCLGPAWTVNMYEYPTLNSWPCLLAWARDIWGEEGVRKTT